MSRLVSRFLAALVFAAALAACSSSSDGVTANAVSVGAIEARPGLVVNGTSYATGQANVIVNGVGGQSGAAFKPGRIARIAHSGVEAAEVRMEPVLEGKMSSRTLAPNQIVHVRGVDVWVDDSTVLVDPSGAATTFDIGFPAGGRFSAYGFPDDSGNIRATRLERLPGSSEDLEMKGFVLALDTVAETFTLQPTSTTTVPVILAGGATLPAGIKNGSFVEVRTTVAPDIDGNFVASSVTLEDAKVGANVEAEIEGIVMSGNADEFVILGTTVVTTGTTAFENGTPAEVVQGVKVEAEGSLDASGVLHARKVSFRSNVRIVGVPTILSATTFQVLGFVVHVDPFTNQVDPINETNAFEIRGRVHGAGLPDLVAERIVDLGNATTDEVLQGPVTAEDATAKTLQILGVTGDISGVPLNDLKDVNDAPFASFAAFFSAVSPGTVVKLRGPPGSFAAGDPDSFLADKAEIEGGR